MEDNKGRMRPQPAAVRATLSSLFGIAAKYAWRHRRKTLLIAFVIALGNFVMLFQLAQGAGQEKAFVDGMIGTLSGHLQVVAGDPTRSSPDEAALQDAVALPHIQRLEAAIRQQPETLAVTRRIRFPAMMSRGDDSWGTSIIGVQPQNERLVSPRLQLASGRFVHAGANEIVVSHDVASTRGLSPGDKVVLLGSTVDGSFNGMELTVVGVLDDAGLARFYSGLAYIPLDRARHLIALENGEAYELVVRLRDTAATDTVAARLRTQLPQLAGSALIVDTWRDTGAIFQGILRVSSGFRLVMAIALGLVILVLVFTSLSVFVHERGAEISTMQAIGYQRGQLLALFVAEGVLVAAAAAALGLALAGVAAGVLGRVGIPAFNEALTYVFAGDRLYPIVRVQDVLGLFFGTIAVAFLAAWLPARRASLSDPARALNRG